MTVRHAVVTVLTAIAVAAAASRAQAGLLSEPAGPGFAPRVPLSAFARPAAWFDASRLHMTSTMSVGQGWGGKKSALSLTSLSYQFRAPLTMSVNIGNSFGLDRARKGSSFFLEGLDLTWRPNTNSMFRLEMHDVRSPLQYGSRARGYGQLDPFSTPY